MRTPVFKRPENDIQIIRLTTGYAVVRLYASYVETPEILSTGGAHRTANVVEIKVPDRLGLETDVINRFSYYYEMAMRDEIKWLTRQYARTVNGLVAKLPPGKKVAVIEKADQMIKEIARGDKEFLIWQDMEKVLKQYI